MFLRIQNLKQFHLIHFRKNIKRGLNLQFPEVLEYILSLKLLAHSLDLEFVVFNGQNITII